MAFLPENSRIKLDKDGQDAISKASSAAEIVALLHEEALRQGHVSQDWDPNIWIENPSAAPQPAQSQHQLAVKVRDAQGKEVVIEAQSQDELTAALTAYVQGQASANESEPANEQAAEQVDAAEALRLQDLQHKFSIGAIDMDTYLRESGAIDRYLAEKGVDVPSLQATSERKFAEDWAAATTEFLAESDWPGGEENLKVVNDIFKANPELMDAEDKVQALRDVVAFARENNMLVANREAEARKQTHEAMATASTPEEIRANALRSVGRDPATAYDVRTWSRGH